MPAHFLLTVRAMRAPHQRFHRVQAIHNHVQEASDNQPENEKDDGHSVLINPTS